MAAPAILQQKVEEVAKIQQNLTNATSFVLVDYKGLTVEQDTKLRAEFRKAGVSYKVLKNRLVKIALNNMGKTEFDEALNGPTAIAMGSTDIAAPARVIMQKSGEFKNLKVKCGFVDGSFLDEKGVKELASLPSKEVLVSKLLGVLLAPLSSFARVIDAIAKKKEENA
jgi:large subunit ribosomal protein L10